jgi:hypothetical protein
MLAIPGTNLLRRWISLSLIELAEALRDLDDVKKNRNEMKKENKELKVEIYQFVGPVTT